MIRARGFFEGKGVVCFGVFLFLVCVLWVFSPVVSKYAALMAPDSMPFFQYAYRTVTFETLMTGGAFTPHTLYWLIFDRLYAHELTYIIDSFVLVLAGFFYLSKRGVHPLAAWCGGLALGFSGYTFTLFSAGHRGYFHMFSCAVWAFGLLACCFETRKLFYFAMLGLVFAWGVPYQPDVLVLVGGVAAAYALWLTFRQPRESLRQMLSVWPRFIVSVAFLLVAGFGGIRSALTTQIANREAQIAGASAQDIKPIKKGAKLTEAEKHERWIFATNWSLPPEDMLEFVAPGVFGNDSMQMPYPYWGRLGRPADEVFQKGRMMPNYRQHTVYLGVVTVLLALLGVLAWASARRRPQRSAVAGSKSGKVDAVPSAAGLSPAESSYGDVPFWLAVWGVCLFLAMGRYTPFYRLFYAIPYIEYIRCPVKFHHLVEVATAFLAGFGMDAFLRGGAVDLRRRLAWVAGGAGVALCLGGGLILSFKADIVAHIGSLGLGQVASSLCGYAAQNLVRSGCLAALVALIIWLTRSGGTRMVLGAGYVLVLVLALDLASIATRYVRVIDVKPLYNENAVVKAIKQSAQGQVVNVVNYVTPNVWGRDWFSSSLEMNGVHNVVPSADERNTPYRRLFDSLQKDPVRLWKIFNVQFVILPRNDAAGLVRTGILRPVLNFELAQGSVKVVEPSDHSLVLAAVTVCSSGARTVVRWKGDVKPESQLAEVERADSVVSEAPDPGNAPVLVDNVTLTCQSVLGLPGALETRLCSTSKKAFLLLFNQRLDAGFDVFVDGVLVPQYLSDGIWLSAVIPGGVHTVMLKRKGQLVPFFASSLCSVACVAWAMFFLMAKNRDKDNG